MRTNITIIGMLVALSAACIEAKTPGLDTLIAHRGESVDAPENSLPAFRTAVERGFGFECDIYMSADGRVFTFHDRTLKRTSGGAMTNNCTDASWETEISKLNVGGWGKWKGSKFDPTRPALFEEVLALARPGRKIYIEIKDGPRIVPKVKELLEAQSKANPETALFICFNEAVCAELKRQLPEYKVYWLNTSEMTAEQIIGKLAKYKLNGIDAKFRPDLHDAEFIRKIHDAGYEFHVWTVNNVRQAKLAFVRGVDSLTTDCARDVLNEYLLEESRFPKRGLIAHRGDRAEFPEDTLPAFKSAVAKHAEMVELDVWRCKTGELVVMHDPTVNRTTNGKGKISDLTFAEIRALDAGIKKDAKFAGIRVPTIKESLESFPKEGVLLNVHCKAGEAAPEVANIARGLGRKNQTILMMDDVTSLLALKAKCPWARTGLVATVPTVDGVWSDESREKQVTEAVKLGIEFFQMLPGCHLTKDQIDRFHAAGIRTTYFYCNKADGFKALIEEGHDFIFTDYYSKLRSAYDAAVLK